MPAGSSAGRALQATPAADGLQLNEIAPGVDAQLDMLAHVDFAPAIASELVGMDSGMLRARWGGMRRALTG